MTDEIREAVPGDAEAIAALLPLVGHSADAGGIADRIGKLHQAGHTQMVVTDGRRLVGLCGLHTMTAIHRPNPVGRVTILVLAEEARGAGLGRMLIEEAERRLAAMGCGMIEITSHVRLTEAHAFYEHMGYERTSYRFFKEL